MKDNHVASIVRIVYEHNKVAGHLQIGSGVKIAAQSGVIRNVGDGETVGGSPARPIKTWMREIATIQKMAKSKG